MTAIISKKKATKTKKPKKVAPKKVKFATQHAAIQATLEVLGTRETPLPVIFPVIAEPEVLSAILRAGALPYPVDITEDLQMCPEALKAALEKLGTAIIMFTPVLNQDISSELTEIAKDHLSIAVYPFAGSENDCKSTFVLRDHRTRNYSHCAVITKFAEQEAELIKIRDGILGLHCGETLSKNSYGISWYDGMISQMVNNGLLATFPVTKKRYMWTEYPVRLGVSKAREIVATLGEGKEYWMRKIGRVGVIPLYDYEEIKSRWPLKNAEFPMAEKVKNEYIFFKPMYDGMPKKVAEVVFSFY